MAVLGIDEAEMQAPACICTLCWGAQAERAAQLQQEAEQKAALELQLRAQLSTSKEQVRRSPRTTHPSTCI